MTKSKKVHPRSDLARVRRAMKERTRRVLKLANTSNKQDPVPRGEIGSSQPHGLVITNDSNVDREAVNLYKKAYESALEKYKILCAKITDGTAAAHMVEWGPINGERDIIQELDRDTELILELRDLLQATVDEVLRDPASEELRVWLNLTREEQKDQQEVWNTLQPIIAKASESLRARLYKVTKVDAAIEKGPQKLRAGLLRGLLKATGSLDADDDTVLLDQILQNGGVGIGIERPIVASGKWPRRPKEGSTEAFKVNHGSRGLSLFASDAWRNYQSASILDEPVRRYLEKEIKCGNMEILPEIPLGGVVSRIAAVEKIKGDPSSPIRVIDDLRRSGINDMVQMEETLQLPGIATSAFLIQQHKKVIQKNEASCTDEATQIMIEIDCAAAYRNIPIEESERKYCMNFIPPKNDNKGLILCHDRLPFGLSPSGLLWVRIYAGVILILKRLVCFPNKEALQIYIDDLTYITSKKDAIQRLLAILIMHEVIGIDLSYHKIRVSSSPVILGFEWNLKTGEVRVPKDRQQRLLDQILPVLDSEKRNKSIDIYSLQSIVGRAAWMAQIICEFRSRLKALYGRLGIARRKELRGINLTTEAVESLEFLRFTLEKPLQVSSNAKAILGAGASIEDDEAISVVVSDASMNSISAVIILPDRAYWFSVPSENREIRSLINKNIQKDEDEHWTSGDISALETIGALAGAALLPRSSPGIVLCDNMAAVEAINRAAGRAERINQLILNTAQKLAFGRGLKVIHISTHENWLVDRLSRTHSLKEARELMAASTLSELDGVYLIKEVLNQS